MQYRVILIFLFFLGANACPRQEDLYPCTCHTPLMEDDSYVTCANLENDQDLVIPAKSLIGKKHVFSVTIQDSSFHYIPSDAFKGLKFSKLEIKDSTLMALTDTDAAFEGLEDHLKILKLDKCFLLDLWDWSIFRNLKKLSTLEIENGSLDRVGDMGKMSLANLKTISFSRNNIDFIDDKAFTKCQKLKTIVLNNNKISNLKRTMFPNPAFELTDIDLYQNDLEQLPDNMFSNMPKLVNLNIGGNKILVIRKEVFSPLWGQLGTFEAMGNELRCDCRMEWMLDIKQPKTIRAECAIPQALKGKSIQSLTSKDLWCLFK